MTQIQSSVRGCASSKHFRYGGQFSKNSYPSISFALDANPVLLPAEVVEVVVMVDSFPAFLQNFVYIRKCIFILSTDNLALAI